MGDVLEIQRNEDRRASRVLNIMTHQYIQNADHRPHTMKKFTDRKKKDKIGASQHRRAVRKEPNQTEQWQQQNKTEVPKQEHMMKKTGTRDEKNACTDAARKCTNIQLLSAQLASIAQQAAPAARLSPRRLPPPAPGRPCAQHQTITTRHFPTIITTRH